MCLGVKTGCLFKVISYSILYGSLARSNSLSPEPEVSPMHSHMWFPPQKKTIKLNKIMKYMHVHTHINADISGSVCPKVGESAPHTFLNDGKGVILTMGTTWGTCYLSTYRR